MLLQIRHLCRTLPQKGAAYVDSEAPLCLDVQSLTASSFSGKGTDIVLNAASSRALSPAQAHIRINSGMRII